MKSLFSLNRLLVILFLAAGFSSCVDKDYDEPVTANVDPDITTNATIAYLKSIAPGSAPVLIDTIVIVSGIVVADDESGNFYKSIIVQDSTAGLNIQVDVTNYYTDYPVGRRIFIKCKGLYVASPSGNLTIGVLSSGEIGRIPSGLIGQYIVKGKWGLSVEPKVYQIDDFGIPTNTLVKFEAVEFTDGDYGVPYAVGSPPIRVVRDCNNNRIDVYSSTYSNFALTRTPIGNGTITGIYTIYSGDGELQIRDTNDCVMRDIRCDGTNGVTTQIPIDSVRMLFTGSNTTAPTGRKIRGTVISDYTTTMINNQNMYIQDNTAGIQVRFSSPHSFAVGSDVEIIISGQEISEFAGVLQLNGIPTGNASVLGSASVTPRNTDIAQINTNYDLWESTLVKLTGVTISGSPGTYSGSKTISDGVNTITLFTSGAATFSGATFPTGTVNITGILTEYNGTKEILIRNTGDVQ